MTTQVIVFISLFAVSVILNIVFSILKMKTALKITYSTHVPFILAILLFYISNFFPDAENTFIISAVSFSSLALFVILSYVPVKFLNLISRLFFWAFVITNIVFYSEIFYLYRVKLYYIIASVIICLVLFILTIIFSKERKIKNIFKDFVFILPSSVMLCVAFFNFTMEFTLWNQLLFPAWVLIYLYELTKIFMQNRTLKVNESIINNVFLCGLILDSLSLVFMVTLIN